MKYNNIETNLEFESKTREDQAKELKNLIIAENQKPIIKTKQIQKPKSELDSLLGELNKKIGIYDL